MKNNMSDNNRNRGNSMGQSTADRDLTRRREDKKQQGISNSGGQRSDQTSNRDNNRKYENKKG